MNSNPLRPALCMVILAAAILCGCQSHPQPSADSADFGFRDQGIYEALRAEPVPIPEATPYDADTAKRGADLDGFNRGWEYVITGTFLRGSVSAPAELSRELRPAWEAGWDSGLKRGIERYSAERRKSADRPPGAAPETSP